MTPDGLILTQEGSCVRARAGRNNCLFGDRTPKAVQAEYEESIAKVRAVFGPRFESASDEVSVGDMHDLTQEIALDWMYFFIVNRLRVHVTDAELSHPQTKNIVWRFSQRKYADEARVCRLSARLLSISETEFKNWLDGWKLYLDR